MKKNARIQLLARALGLVFILPCSSALAEPATTIYMSASNDDVNEFTSPGPVSNFAHLPLFTNPEGLAFDTFGNLFVAGGGDISKITPGGVVSHFGNLPPGSGGYGMAIDRADNLYVAGVSAGQISKITPSGTVSLYANLAATGLAMDSVGNLFATSGNTVQKIAPGGGTPSIYATFPGFNNTYGVAIDSFGFVYVSDITTATLFKVPPGGGSYTSFGSLAAGVKGLAFDHSGNLFGTQPFADMLSKITPDGTATIYATGLNGPRYLAFQSGPAKAAPVAGCATPIPGGTGNFTGLPGAPGYNSSGQVAFYGEGAAGQQGIYRMQNGPPIKVADLNTAIPNGTGNFTAFFIQGPPITPAIDGNNVAFFGAGSSGQQGIYVSQSGPPIRIADAATAIPGGTGNFTSFIPGNPIAPNPAISGNKVAFFGAGSGGQQGIYVLDYVALNGPPIKIADTVTAIPAGTGTFTSLPQEPSISGDNLAFFGNGSGGQQGIYRGGIVGPPIKVADLNTAIPGGSGNFTSFMQQGPPIIPAIDGASVAFFGAGSAGQQGVYVSVNGPPIKIADTSTTIPGGTGSFTSFGDVSISATDVAFLGLGANGQQGVYDMTGGSLLDVVDLTDILDGRSITGLSLSRSGLSGDPIAFQAAFADGSQGMYIWTRPVLAGDYDHNGVVDAADYVVWRKGLGTTYAQTDYDVWRAHFGQSAGSGSGVIANAAVPEPATFMLLMFAVASGCLLRSRAS